MFGIGLVELVILFVIGPLVVAPIWALGTLFKAALGWSKWTALLYLVPGVNYVVLVVAGVQAHQRLKAQS